MKTHDSIFIAGHKGLVGSALVRVFRGQGFERLILRGRDQLDLEDSHAVRAFLKRKNPVS